VTRAFPIGTVLVGAHIRQYRRTRHLVWGAVTALAVLLVAALVAAVVAFQQRATAQRERDTAIFNQITAQTEQLSVRPGHSPLLCQEGTPPCRLLGKRTGEHLRSAAQP
jgi:hypothetical protein